MDYHNIRSATYALDALGAPTWRDASIYIRSNHDNSNHPLNSHTPESTTSSIRSRLLSSSSSHGQPRKGWYLGKFLGIIVSGLNKGNVSNDDDESIDIKNKRKRQFLKDYYSILNETNGFSDEFSMLSDLPLMMGWLRKRKPR